MNTPSEGTLAYGAAKHLWTRIFAETRAGLKLYELRKVNSPLVFKQTKNTFIEGTASKGDFPK